MISDILNYASTMPAWMERASCTDSPDLDDWFSDSVVAMTIAKRTCADCPVRNQCLAFAFEHDEQYGIWGGLTPRERRAVVKKASAA